MSPRAVLVNRHEQAADRDLRRVCVSHGARVLTKVRVADAVDVDEMNLLGSERWYALSAHLDFLVVDEPSAWPLFAVELDGRTTHADPQRVGRDQLKDRICASGGLELLRVDTPFLRRFGPYRLLSYLVECWFMFQAFERAEERGELPPYADFDPKWVVTLRSDGQGAEWPYAVDLPVRLRILELYKSGQLPHPTPRHGAKHAHNDRLAAYALLDVPGDLYLLAEANLRPFRFRTGSPPSEIAEDLAVLELGVLLDAYLRGEPVAVDDRAVDALRKRTSGPEWTHDALLG